jgi:hypothetical protein
VGNVLIAVMTVGIMGCADRVDAPARVVAEPASIATLVVKGAAGHAGDVVTLSARLTETTVAKRTGAFLAHIEYDTALVTYIGQGDAAGGIAAFHAQSGVLRAAGASLDGYGSGVLFNAQFRVARPSSGAEVRLVIDELRDMSLNDRLPPQPGARSSVVRPFR